MSPGLRLFPNKNMFLIEEFLATSLNQKLEEQPLPAVRQCLFNILTVSFHFGGRSCIRNLSTRHVVETRTHLSGSNSNNCKICKLHGLTLVGLGETVLVNEVTIVVNCYGVVSSSQGCCKSDVIECYFVDSTLELNIWIVFLWGKKRLHICRQLIKFSSAILWTILQNDYVGCLDNACIIFLGPVDKMSI